MGVCIYTYIYIVSTPKVFFCLHCCYMSTSFINVFFLVYYIASVNFPPQKALCNIYI